VSVDPSDIAIKLAKNSVSSKVITYVRRSTVGGIMHVDRIPFSQDISVCFFRMHEKGHRLLDSLWESCADDGRTCLVGQAAGWGRATR